MRGGPDGVSRGQGGEPDGEYLVGIGYHEPEAFALWNRGMIEDYESSTGLFVEAATPEEALAWAGGLGEDLLRHVNGDPALDWKAYGYDCWLEDAPAASGWGHCLDFFPQMSASARCPTWTG